jgi:ribose transport system substrate-binding protein
MMQVRADRASALAEDLQTGGDMKATRFIAAGGAALLALSAVAPVVAQDEMKDPGAAAGAKLYVNMKGPSSGNPFWALVEQGAVQAGADYGVEVNVVAPAAESDIPGQIALIEDNAAAGATGMAIAVTDPAALGPAIQAVIDQGVKVVWVDAAGSNEGITYIGTDNAVGAALAGQYLCDNLEPGSKVAILQGIITTTTGQARAEGSAEAVKACGLDLVMEVAANFDRAQGLAATEDIITQHPDLAGLFGSNDEMALGALEALRAADMLDQVTLVGYDANPDAREAILAGEMEATIAQNPINMGYFGVESLIKLINGEELPATIDTGVALITAENAAG